jgi:hypothetical protein
LTQHVLRLLPLPLLAVEVGLRRLLSCHFSHFFPALG